MKKLNAKGLTLIEMTVTLLIVSVVIIFTSGILMSSFNGLTSTAVSNESKTIGDSMYNWLSEKIIYCTDLKIVTADAVNVPLEAEAVFVDADENSFTYGHLMYKKSGDSQFIDFYGHEFYNNSTAVMNVRGYDKYLVDLQIEIYDRDGNKRYYTGSSMEVLNMRLADISIQDGSGSDIDMPLAAANPVLIFQYDALPDSVGP
jgi:prepilin-type N-terminal cleavage/methylation domain-containing protein